VLVRDGELDLRIEPTGQPRLPAKKPPLLTAE
jgi:hypothetical protein